MQENVSVVIRSSDERTTNLCFHIVESQVEKKNIFIIQEKPFFRAVKKTFEIGIDQNLTWTLAVDADILLREKAIQDIIKNVEKLPKKIQEKLYVYQGHVLCKVFGRPRQAGLHLYQTKHLQTALKEVCNNPGSLRPESSTYKAMNKMGFYHYVDNKLYALHDYEQYSIDLFRKGYFIAKKFFKPEYLSYLLPFWKENEAEDDDYKFILEGWACGLLDDSKIEVDIDYFREKSVQEIKKYDFTEKPEINLDSEIELIQNISRVFDKAGPFVLETNLRPKTATLKQRIKRKLRL